MIENLLDMEVDIQTHLNLNNMKTKYISMYVENIETQESYNIKFVWYEFFKWKSAV